MKNKKQILRGDQTTCEANFKGQSRMLTCDLFAIANLLVQNVVRRPKWVRDSVLNIFIIISRSTQNYSIDLHKIW